MVGTIDHWPQSFQAISSGQVPLLVLLQTDNSLSSLSHAKTQIHMQGSGVWIFDCTPHVRRHDTIGHFLVSLHTSTYVRPADLDACSIEVYQYLRTDLIPM